MELFYAFKMLATTAHNIRHTEKGVAIIAMESRTASWVILTCDNTSEDVALVLAETIVVVVVVMVVEGAVEKGVMEGAGCGGDEVLQHNSKSP